MRRGVKAGERGQQELVAPQGSGATTSLTNYCLVGSIWRIFSNLLSVSSEQSLCRVSRAAPVRVGVSAAHVASRSERDDSGRERDAARTVSRQLRV